MACQLVDALRSERQAAQERVESLGEFYPPETWTGPNPNSALKEGDTPSWFYFYENGLNVPSEPGFGGWGGRFTPNGKYYQDAADTVGNETSGRATV
jgi:hypothetical protein